jgi:hypothetical protein
MAIKLTKKRGRARGHSRGVGNDEIGGITLYLRHVEVGRANRWWLVNRGGAPWLNPSLVCEAPRRPA